LNEYINKKEWKLTKTVLPQHTDHAGVMWHGSYFDFLEEGRIEALNQVGVAYSKLSTEGYEIPVIEAKIKYKKSFFHGEEVLLISQYNLVYIIRLNCKTSFVKVNGEIGAEALVELVVVKRKNDLIKVVREFPVEIKRIFLLLEEGPEI